MKLLGQILGMLGMIVLLFVVGGLWHGFWDWLNEKHQTIMAVFAVCILVPIFLVVFCCTFTALREYYAEKK
jgi:4-amino-4-deoxy-L-arabinose transferase-like glycosyltransferase